MLVPVVVMVAVGMGVALAPGLADDAEHAAARFVDTAAYAEQVIDGVGADAAVEPEAEHHGYTGVIVASIATTVVSAGVTAPLIARRRLPQGAAAVLGYENTAAAPLRAGGLRPHRRLHRLAHSRGSDVRGILASVVR